MLLATAVDAQTKTMSAHPKSWFLARIGKEVQRVKPKGGGLVSIEDKLHAEYLYDLQCEGGYRYEDPAKI